MAERLPPRSSDPSLATDPVPSGRIVLERVITSTGDWQMQQRGGEYELICSGVFLMATYNRRSDWALATCALERIQGDQLRVLVAGLGVGFTAQAALNDPRVEFLEIVEVEPVVVRWHRDYFAPLCGRPLDDPRTRLSVLDFYELALSSASFDAILMDTDNGPDWVTRPINARLYQQQMLRRLLDSLTARGVLTVWSANPAEEFAHLLADLAGGVEAVETEDQDGACRRHPAWVYVARPRR